MKVNYFREMRNHHLVVTAGACQCADYQMKMIRQNEIRGLLCPAMRQIDGETEYDYLITGCQSLQTFVETAPVSAKVLSVLVNGLCAILDELDRYLLDGEYLSLRPEYIYLERSGEEITGVKYCIFPFQSRLLEEQIRELFKYMINEVDYQDKEAVRVAYELFQAASQDSVDPVELGRLVGTLKKETEMGTGIVAETPVETETGRGPELSTSAQKENSLAAVPSEEILWVDDSRKKKIKNRKPVDRMLPGKCEIVLPETGKKSILKMIIRSKSGGNLR